MLLDHRDYPLAEAVKGYLVGLNFDPDTLPLPIGHFIGGRLIPAEGAIEMRRPSDGKRHAGCPIAGKDIVDQAVAAIQGGLGFAASANINSNRTLPSMFEPVHGSAPDIAHLGIANPIAALWSSAMMLDHLGEKEAAGRIMRAIKETTARSIGAVPGRDRTEAITAAVLSALS